MLRCPACGAVTPTGPNCDVANNDWFTWDGSGTWIDPYILQFRLNTVDPDQLLQCTGDGLLAEIPTSIRDPSAAQAYDTTHPLMTSGVMTTVELNAEVYDSTGSMHSNAASTSRVTVPVAGVYLVTFNVAWQNFSPRTETSGIREAQIRKNGSSVVAYDTKESGNADLIVGHCLTILELCAANDYFEGRVRHNATGQDLRIVTETYSPYLSACLVAT